MSNLIEECNLLRENKRDLVDALSAIGMAVDMSTPLSRLADNLKWASGYAGVGVAAIDKTSGQHVVFTDDRWQAMTLNQRLSYNVLGVCILAEGRGLVIAMNDVLYNDSQTMIWSGKGYNIPFLTDYAQNVLSVDFYNYRGAENTGIILDAAIDQSMECPAAQQARAYKAFNGDPTEWFLGSVGEWRLLEQYRTDVNVALAADGGNALAADYYWTSDEWGPEADRNAWAFTSSGALVYRFKTATGNASRVRPFAPLSPTAIINP